MKTNLEKYAEEMSKRIKKCGTDQYHWSEITAVIDELLKYADFSNGNVGCRCGGCGAMSAKEFYAE